MYCYVSSIHYALFFLAKSETISSPGGHPEAMQPSLSGYKCGPHGPAIYCLGKYDSLCTRGLYYNNDPVPCLGFEKSIERSRWLGTPIEEVAVEDENGEVACYTMKMCVEVP